MRELWLGSPICQMSAMLAAAESFAATIRSQSLTTARACTCI